MPKEKLMYIELKTGFQDNGPSWIAKVKFSKSGQTVYFNGNALKRNHGRGISGNHYDLETGDEYWISGVKKDGNDRHWAGSGKIKIDSIVVDEYLHLTGEDELDMSRFEICTDIQKTQIDKFHKVENEQI